MKAFSLKQQKLDSIQIAVLRNKTLVLDAEYKKARTEVVAVQKEFLNRAKGMYAYPFVKASLRENPSEILKTPQGYMSNITTTFFDNIDFSNTTLINSTFLTNRILDYVFYIKTKGKKKEILMECDEKNKTFYIKYKGLWSVFSGDYEINYDDIQSFTTITLETLLKSIFYHAVFEKILVIILD